MIHSGKVLYGLICYGLTVPGLFVGTVASHAQSGLLATPQTVDSIIAGLQHYIPVRMQADAVSGLSIVLVQNHRTIWTEGFGIIILATIVNRLTGSMPKNFSATPNAIGSMTSTAPDLAVLVIGLSRAIYLNSDLAFQNDSAQIQINEDFSWGWGIGIRHTRHGDAIRQNAITFTFRGIMAIYPQKGYGVVVLTNSETGLPGACDIAERALGCEAKYKFFNRILFNILIFCLNK